MSDQYEEYVTELRRSALFNAGLFTVISTTMGAVTVMSRGLPWTTCGWIFLNSTALFGSVFTFNFAIQRHFPEIPSLYRHTMCVGTTGFLLGGMYGGIPGALNGALLGGIAGGGAGFLTSMLSESEIFGTMISGDRPVPAGPQRSLPEWFPVKYSWEDQDNQRTSERWKWTKTEYRTKELLEKERYLAVLEKDDVPADQQQEYINEKYNQFLLERKVQKRQAEIRELEQRNQAKLAQAVQAARDSGAFTVESADSPAQTPIPPSLEDKRYSLKQTLADLVPVVNIKKIPEKSSKSSSRSSSPSNSVPPAVTVTNPSVNDEQQ